MCRFLEGAILSWGHSFVALLKSSGTSPESNWPRVRLSSCRNVKPEPRFEEVSLRSFAAAHGGNAGEEAAAKKGGGTGRVRDTMMVATAAARRLMKLPPNGNRTGSILIDLANR